jgi:hypothetical protein
MKLSKKLLLRLFLIYSALGWGICAVGIFISSDFAFELLKYFGGIDPIALKADPMYDYWFRMAASVFALVGLFYLILGIKPKKYAVVIPLAGCFMIIEGIILGVHGYRLGLPSTPWLGDVGFCIVGGIGILCCMDKN